MHQVSAFFLSLVDHVGYLGLFIAMTAGNIGAPIGSEIILPGAGALVASGHLSNVWLVVLVAVLGELVGGSLGYAIGRLGGRPFVHRYGHYVMFHEEEMAKVDAFFARYGSFAIFICRFIPVIRGVAAIPAGIARMPLPAFYLWTALGSLGFCGALVALGNALGKNAATLAPLFHRFEFAIIILLVLAVGAGIYWLISHRRKSAISLQR